MKKISDKICKEFAARHNCLEAHSIDEIRCVLDDAISIPELTASRDSRLLSAVPSGAVLKSPYGFMTIGTVRVENGHPIINENQLHGISLTHEVPSHWIKVLH